MKADTLVKVPMKLEDIYSDIDNTNNLGHYKFFIPNYVYIEEATIHQLIADGFKIQRGDLELIIQW